jgi:hypothetical protein
MFFWWDMMRHFLRLRCWRWIDVVVMIKTFAYRQSQLENTSPLALLPVSFSLQNYLNYSFYVFD